MKSISKATFAPKFSLVLITFCLIVLEATPALADPGGARTVKYSQQDIISVRAKLRFSTLIVLPQNEEILDYATGDKEFWIINGAHNPDRYFTFATLALALSILTMVWGPFWLEPFSSAAFWLFPKSQQRTNSSQEENYEKHLEGHVRS